LDPGEPEKRSNSEPDGEGIGDPGEPESRALTMPERAEEPISYWIKRQDGSYCLGGEFPTPLFPGLNVFIIHMLGILLYDAREQAA
jgi:hypothetical protein